MATLSALDLQLLLDFSLNWLELPLVASLIIIVFIRCIQWVLSFNVCYAAMHRVFAINSLSGKLHQLASPNLQDIFIRR